jgi:ABC-type sugar transport system ATPase subunit
VVWTWGAKYEIYALADRLAAEGTAVLFISSEIEELMGCATASRS